MRLRAVLVGLLAAGLPAAPAARAATTEQVYCSPAIGRDVLGSATSEWSGTVAAVVDVPGASTVTLGCVLQAAAAPGQDVLFGVYAVSGGRVGILAGPVAFESAPGAHLYVCTYVQWPTADGPQTLVPDGDPATPGTQCLLLQVQTDVVSVGTSTSAT